MRCALASDVGVVRLGVGTPDATLDKSAYCQMGRHG
jgi:hypothetical protein